MLERSSPIPLYHQLKQLLAAKIQAGDWKAGDLIPAEAELQATYALSRTTVRLALRELEVDGTLSRYRGRGTFVSKPKLTHSSDPARGLASALEAQGIAASWRVLAADWVDPPEDVRVQLQISNDARAYCLKRLRLAGEEPIGLHIAHVAAPFADTLNSTALGEGSSLSYLDHHVAVMGGSAERLIDATVASPEDAALLEIEAGTPMLRIRRLIVSRGGAPIEHCQSIYRGDRFQYHVRSPAAASDRNRD